MKFSVEHQRLHHGRPLLQGRGQHGRPHRQPVVGQRATTGDRHLRERNRQRLADVGLCHASGDHGRRDLHGQLPHEHRALRRDAQILDVASSPADRCKCRPTAASSCMAPAASRRRRSRQQLLGRRAVRQQLAVRWQSEHGEVRPADAGASRRAPSDVRIARQKNAIAPPIASAPPGPVRTPRGQARVKRRLASEGPRLERRAVRRPSPGCAANFPAPIDGTRR